MTVTKIVPLTNVGLLSAAIERAQARPIGLPGVVVMYGASGLGKSVGAAFAANLHRAYYVECRDTWSKKAFLQAILREMSIAPAPTLSMMVDQVAEQLSRSTRPLLIDDVQYLLEKAVANVLTDIYNAMGDYSIQESTEQGGLARISQNFAEAGETPRPDSEPVPGAEVNAAADQVQEEAVSEFEDQWDVSGFTSSVAEGAIENLQSATSTIANAGGLLSGAGQMNNLVNGLTNSFQELILAPGKLAAGLLATVRSLTSTTNPFAALRAQMSLFDFGRNDKPVRVPSYTTPAREQQAINQAAVSTLIERIAVAEATRIATGRPLDKAGHILPGPVYDNRDEAVVIRDEIVIELDRQQLHASPERYPALVMLTARLVKDMNRRSTDLIPLTQHTPLSTQPALLIAHRLYGDARRATEIVSRNRIAHPGFVQGGQILEVLKHA